MEARRPMTLTFAVADLSRQQPITPGSEEEFITEHYWGYTKRA